MAIILYVHVHVRVHSSLLLFATYFIFQCAAYYCWLQRKLHDLAGSRRQRSKGDAIQETLS